MSIRKTLAASALSLLVPAVSVAQNRPAPVDGVVVGNPDITFPFADARSCIGFGKFYADTVGTVRCEDRASGINYAIVAGKLTVNASTEPKLSPPFASSVPVTGVHVGGTKPVIQSFGDATSCLAAGAEATAGENITTYVCLDPNGGTYDVFRSGKRTLHAEFKNLAPAALPALQR